MNKIQKILRKIFPKKILIEPKYENIPCNLCKGDNFEIIYKSDRYGFKANMVKCKNCGLRYINPRMTKESYDAFYTLTYRDLLAKTKNKPYLIDKLFETTYKSFEKIENDISVSKDLLVVEVGSGVGGLLFAIKEKTGAKVIGIEPNKEEAQYAEFKGIKTIKKVFEDIGDDLGAVDVILIMQSLNHLLDPMEFLKWANKHLVDGGKLIMSVLIWKEGKPAQIDHTYAFSVDNLKMYLKESGFSSFNINDFNKGHAKIVAKK